MRGGLARAAVTLSYQKVDFLGPGGGVRSSKDTPVNPAFERHSGIGYSGARPPVEP